MSLLTDTPVSPPIDHAAVAAASLLAHPAAEMRRRIDNHAMLYHMFWDNPNATPARIAAAMGARGVEFLTFAGVNVTQFAQLAAADGIILSDVIKDEDWMPRLPLIPNPDGTVTVGTGDGLDAWGNPPPPPPSDPSDPSDPSAALAAQIGLTEEQVDAMFAAGAALAV